MATITITYDRKAQSGAFSVGSWLARGKKIVIGALNMSTGLSLDVPLKNIDLVLVANSSNYMFNYDSTTGEIYGRSASTGNVISTASAAVFTSLKFVAFGDN